MLITLEYLMNDENSSNINIDGTPSNLNIHRSHLLTDLYKKVVSIMPIVFAAVGVIAYKLSIKRFM